MFFLVPINGGLLDINYMDLEEGIQISETEAYVKLRPEGEMRLSWQAITEEQFNQAKPIVVPINESPIPTIQEIKENQLILMEAIADLFEAIKGGVA